MSSKKYDKSKISFGSRLRKLRSDKKYTIDTLAQAIGISKSTISELENNKYKPSSTALIRLSEIFHVTPSWLLTGEGEMEVGGGMVREPEGEYNSTVAAPGDEFIFIPQVSDKINAGKGLVAYNDIEMRVAFRRDWIRRKGDPKKMSLIKVSGDSMEPTLFSGDLVLVNHDRNYIDPQGGIYAIALNDSIMVKRLQMIYPEKKIEIISDNPKYRPLLAEHDQVKINGRAIWFAREIDGGGR